MSLDLTVMLWRAAPDLARHYADKAASAFRDLCHKSAAPLVWHDPDAGESWERTDEPPPGFGERPWVPVKTAAVTMQDVVRPLMHAWHLIPNKVNALYGGPTPLASTLAGGLLGAGLGYGAGHLAEMFFPKDVLERGRLRRTTAVLGGLLGAAPGLYTGQLGMYAHQGPGSAWKSWVEPNVLFGKESAPHEAFTKGAWLAGGDYMPTIPVDAFNRAIYSDPNTPLPLQAATAGLTTMAERYSGSPFVSPADIARIAVGAGSGYISGAIVGRVLGALAGLTPQAQRTLQQAGMWSGVLRSTVPLAFGG